MNKNQIVYIIGVGSTALIGGLYTRYTSRKAFERGRLYGYEMAMEVYNLLDDVKNIVNKKTES